MSKTKAKYHQAEVNEKKTVGKQQSKKNNVHY